MTIEEWAKDFKSYVNELQMPRDDYKGIMSYIDDALALLKEQPQIVRCKDCKHNDGARCENFDIWVENDMEWFCAEGERRTD